MTGTGFTGGASSTVSSGGASGTFTNGGAGAPAAPYMEPADPVDATQVPSSVPTVNLTVATSDVQALDAAPFSDVDVPGAFTDSSGTQYPAVAVHYRGAYALQTLIQSGASQRNWKVKFAKDQKYRSRREWNFTYEPDVRQKLAYDLLHLAGVRLPSARHVLLVVNGKNQGPYLEYEDPDDKAFLQDQFADDGGDLYKAAQDVPNQPRYFATFEVLGTADQDYFLHYDKKTNNDSNNATDFSLLRTFIQELNSQPNTEFPAWLSAHFDVPKFLSYLVVANFISHWDGYPHRPKNFWLYQVPAAERWVFIPWDMDATFQSKKFTLNGMGTTASIFYQFDQTEPYGGHPEEGTERPLVRLAMKDAGLRAAYVGRYRAALGSFLAKDFVRERIDALAALIAPLVVGREMTTFTNATEDMRAFVPAKYDAVTAELAVQP
jgi:spore coat protein H